MAVPLRPAWWIAMALVAAFLLWGISEGMDEVMARYEGTSPWLLIGISIIVGLVVLTLIARNASKVTVPAILAVAVLFILMGLL